MKFEKDVPMIIVDLADYLTGAKGILKSSSIDENAEFPITQN